MLLTANASGVRMQGLFEALYATQGVFIPPMLNGMVWGWVSENGLIKWHDMGGIKEAD